jgi:hypothetical protein
VGEKRIRKSNGGVKMINNIHVWKYHNETTYYLLFNICKKDQDKKYSQRNKKEVIPIK